MSTSYENFQYYPPEVTEDQPVWAFPLVDGAARIPEGTKEIPDLAFEYCQELREVTIPEGVTSIGRRAFANCTNLTVVNLPETIESIGFAAFRECKSLVEISLPDHVTTIADRAFSYCHSLLNIDIPKGVTRVETGAFYDCGNLTNVRLPQGLTTIMDSAFCDCKSLKGIQIPEGVTGLGNYAFYNCHRLETISLPDGISQIGPNALPASIRRIYCSSFKLLTSLREREIAVLSYVSDPAALDKAPGREEILDYFFSKEAYILPLALEEDLVEVFRLLADHGRLTLDNVQEQYLDPATKAGALECAAFLLNWKNQQAESQKEDAGQSLDDLFDQRFSLDW